MDLGHLVHSNMSVALFVLTERQHFPADKLRPQDMTVFQRYAPYRADEALLIKVIFHLPASEETNEDVEYIKPALLHAPGKYNDVLSSPLSYWQTRHPALMK